MRVTFLEHSGFLVETGFAALLFDWWKGELPALPPGVPLYVFASHVHPDHFDPKIFALNDGNRDVSFLLGKGVSLDPRHLQRWGVSPETVEKARVRQGGQTLSLPQVEIETLSSTDEGVAFLVTLPDGRTVFQAWNRNMEVDFKKYTEPLRGRKIDLAMLPLDPRLGEAGFWGPAYFLETADIRHFLPMHQWGDFEFSRKFLEENPAFTERTVPVERAGQVFTF